MAKEKSPEIVRLKQVLDEIGLEISDIASETGVSERTIKNLLWNDLPIGGQFLRQLNRCYGVSLDWLLSGEGSTFTDTAKAKKIGPLIPKFEHVDTKNSQDVFIIAAAAIEQSMMQCGAVPGEDYTVLDLFKLAQPFALESFKQSGHDLKFLS